jgi:hypothetical protein
VMAGRDGARAGLPLGAWGRAIDPDKRAAGVLCLALESLSTGLELSIRAGGPGWRSKVGESWHMTGGERTRIGGDQCQIKNGGGGGEKRVGGVAMG